MDAMETRRLGRDGPELTRFGLRLAALGRPAYIALGHAGDFPAIGGARRARRALTAASGMLRVRRRVVPRGLLAGKRSTPSMVISSA